MCFFHRFNKSVFYKIERMHYVDRKPGVLAFLGLKLLKLTREVQRDGRENNEQIRNNVTTEAEFLKKRNTQKQRGAVVEEWRVSLCTHHFCAAFC